MYIPWRIEYPGALYHIMSRGNDRLDREKPEQKGLKKSLDIKEQLEKAAALLDVDIDIEKFKNPGRLQGRDKTRWDILINLLCGMGIFKNEEIGNDLGICYSAVSKSVTAIKEELQRDKVLKEGFEVFNSQFKM